MKWTRKIQAFLHDPPDKAFELKTHEKRAKKILGDLTPSKSIRRKIKKADIQASSLQRIDLEKSKKGKSLVSTFDKVHDTNNFEYLGYPVIRHPLTGEIKEFCAIAEYLPKTEKDSYENEFNELLNKRILEIEKKTFSNLVKSGDRDDYLRVWAFYEEELKNTLKSEFSELFAEEFVKLPAYTLSPDHTLFDHADATSAIYGAEYNGRKPILLLFKLNPVQKFIADARKEKDLWAASHLLSVLTFSAISAIIDKFGSDAVIYPHLRGNPFFHAWIFSQNIWNLELESETLSVASIPNKFFTLIGIEDENELDELRKEVKENVNRTMEELFESIWNKVWNDIINDEIDEIIEDISKKLKKEIDKCNDEKRKISLENELKEVLEYRSSKKNQHKEILLNHFNVTLSCLRVPEVELSRSKEEAYAKLKNFVKSLKLPENVEKKYIDWLEMLEGVEASDNKPSKYDLYSLYYELLLEVNAIESAKFVRHEEPAGFKCTLCGEHLAIGGENERFMKALWEKIHRKKPEYVRENEHLCATCLVKRFYPELIDELEIFKKINHKDVTPKIESVSEIAMNKRTKAGITWKEIYDFLRDHRSFGELREDIKSKKPEDVVTELEGLKKALKNLIEHVVEQIKEQRIYSDTYLDKLPKSFDNEILYIENLRNTKSLLDTLGFKELKNVEIDEKLLSEVREILSEIYKKIGEPPKYYAILVMDGDMIGKFLSGDKLQATANYLHPTVLENIGDKLRIKTQTVRRLITPATHAAISRAVKNFSVNYVPEIVKNNKGALVYTGGDDVLALLPVDTVFDTAVKLAEIFSKSWNGWEILPGGTISAGIIIVHYKHPLYDAAEKARSMLEKAKKLGRNAMAVGFLKRSGTYYEAVTNYETVSYAKAIANLIKEDRISSRAIYDIMDVVESIPKEEALMQIVKYEAGKHARNSNDVKGFMSSFSNGIKGVRVEFERGDEISNVVEFQKLVNELVREGKVNKLRELSDLCGGTAYDSIVKKQTIGFLSLVKIILDSERGDGT